MPNTLSSPASAHRAKKKRQAPDPPPPPLPKKEGHHAAVCVNSLTVQLQTNAPLKKRPRSPKNRRAPPPPPPPPPPPAARSATPSTGHSTPTSSCRHGHSCSDSGVNSDPDGVDDYDEDETGDKVRRSASSASAASFSSGRCSSRVSRDSLDGGDKRAAAEAVVDEDESVSRTLRNLTNLRNEMAGGNGGNGNVMSPPPPPPEFCDSLAAAAAVASPSVSLCSSASSSSSSSSSSSPPSPPLSSRSQQMIQQARGTLRRRQPSSDSNLEKSLADRLDSFHVSEAHHVDAVVDDDDGAFAGVRVLSPIVDQLRRESEEVLAGKEANNAGTAIRSKRGTVRGVRNRVRQGIATFLRDPNKKNFSDREQGRVVVYITTLGVLRETYARCVMVRQILRTLLIKHEERDVFMSRENQLELVERMGWSGSATEHDQLRVPQVFVEGRLLGDAAMIEGLNERGELRHILKPFKSPHAIPECQKCGGFRMLPCQTCRGSKKSVNRNIFTETFVALRCSRCDDSALVRCDAC